MRTPAPDDRPVAMTIAGSDAGGGAGIQADLATMAAHGVFGTSVITAVTAQNTQGVERSFTLPIEDIEAQLSAVLEDFDVAATKTGMLATADVVQCVADHADEFAFPLVVDPVMVATSGDRLLAPEAESAYRELLEAATIVTPNADEAAVLTDISVMDYESARMAGESLLETGVDAALIKGGHVPGDTVADVLVTPDDVTTFEHPRIDTDATHGSGCTLASAIASRLARGEELEPAVSEATAFLERAVRYHYDVGQGPGAVNHAVDARNREWKAETLTAVRDLADQLVGEDISSLVPETGLAVAGATPVAESAGDVAAVDGGLVRTSTGVRRCSDIRFGLDQPISHVLLATREIRPEIRFGVSCRYDDRVADAVSSLGWSTCELRGDEKRSDDSTDGEEVERPKSAVGDTPETESPVEVVIDRSSANRRVVGTLLDTDPDALRNRIRSLAEHVE